MKRIELLAPAKDYASAVAAVDFGADAVYIGGARFGARHAAGNSDEEIARVVRYAHPYGVRVHATLNTLLWDDELEAAEQQARGLIAAGVDALIVQDMALRRMSLPVELHASTQMHTMTPEQAVFLEKCGFARVILERALSLDEVRAICAATHAEVECFVHGAICVGYSGRCFLSRSMGPRSGNRGACSQPCRLTYDLTNGAGRSYISGRHLLSVRDLNLTAHIGELIDAGVTSFKIEGRLKDTNYIKNVVAAYRHAIDEAIAARTGFVRSSVGISIPDFEPDPAKSFTRGESDYFFAGRGAGVASFDTPKAIGELIGEVVSLDRRSFTLDRPHTLAAGDGICFAGVGTNINAVAGGRVQPNRMEGIAIGMELYRNYDHRFNQLVAHSRTRRVIPVRALFVAAADRIGVYFTDLEGVHAEVAREGVFEEAKDPQKMAETVRTQLMKSGDTLFDVRDVEGADGRYFIPVSVLGALRREGLQQLLEQRLARPMTHRILPDDLTARHPSTHLTAEQNLTNHMAEAFYRDHGVQSFERGLDLAPTTTGHCVMQTAYCLRREIGECLRENPQLHGNLYLERGNNRYRLEFDCVQCEMRLIDESNKK
ncbi:MAG: U32 family peptidase [Alistipes sp.]